MLKEIGSNFWLNPEENYPENNIDINKYHLLGTDYIFTSSGRGAEDFVLQTIEERSPGIEKTAVIPPFTCGTVVEPFIRRNYKVFSYDITLSLDSTSEYLQEVIQKTGAKIVLFHRYFGFDTVRDWRNMIKKFQREGVIFIEDKTHSLYGNHASLFSDYVVGSFRKWCGVPDGGYAICKEGKFSWKPSLYDEKLEKMKMEASSLKYAYMIHDKGEKDKFLKAYQEAEEQLNNQQKYYSMSAVAQKIQASLDIEYIKRRRRENYQYLYNALSNISDLKVVTPKLSEEDVPLYLCLISKDRDGLQRELRKHDIYAPILWPREMYGVDICSDAEMLYQKSICLPIDQRYGLDDMERMAGRVKEISSHE